MKILLTIITTIILIFSVIISVFVIKKHHSPALDKPTPIATTIINPKASMSSNLAPTPTVNHAVVVSPPKVQPVTHMTDNNKIHNKVAGMDVDKLISVASSQGLKPKALKAALNAYTWALNHEKLGSNKNIVTVVDFTMPSYEKRMWVLNLKQSKVLMKLYTTQGSGSGLVYANRFSNTGGSQATSLGLYVTSDEYSGKHGRSLRLDGLQKGVNSNARNRDIVIHEAAYASPSYVKANHRAGRSWGCFAVAPESKKQLLNYVKGGSVFFAYARSIEKTQVVSNGPLSI